MKYAGAGIVVLAAIVTAACAVGTMEARVRVAGRLEQPVGEPQCQLYLVDASEKPELLIYGREIRGRFVEGFTVHPWGGPYRAVVKCGERVAISQIIEFWEFRPEPYDLGRISAGSRLSQPAFQDPFTRPQIDWRPSLVLDVADAERILGNKSRLESVTAYLDEGARAYQARFRDDQLDPATGKTGALGYRYEEYPSAEAARSYLDSTLIANRLSPKDGIRVEGGAELHYFDRGDVTRMFMVLKGNRLIVLKVNPVTSHYSLVELRKVAAELAKQL